MNLEMDFEDLKTQFNKNINEIENFQSEIKERDSKIDELKNTLTKGNFNFF